jgi:hypothetical protein
MQRVADALRMLAVNGADTWVASAPPGGPAHLVPLSYAWDGSRVTLAAGSSSLTVRNVRASGRARLGFGPTRDVVIVDAILDEALDAAGAPGALGDAYARQARWDPRREPTAYTFLLLRPRRVQAWREANELAGRTLMRDGEWLFEPEPPGAEPQR